MRSRVRSSIFGLIVCVAALPANCGRFWHDESKTLAAVWMSSNEFAVPHMTFQERKSWNPFSSGELRRNFKTSIQFLKREGDKAVPSQAKPLEFDGMLISGPARVFGGIMFVRRLPSEKAWAHELTYVMADGTVRTLVKSGQRGATIRGLLLAPDGQSILLVYNVNSEQYVLVMLNRILGENELPVTEMINVGGTPQIAWDSASTKVYIKGSKSLLTWDGKRIPQPSTSGPACFFPPTKFGLAVSDDGASAVLANAADSTSWSFPQRKPWIPHNRVPMTTGDQVGRGCPRED